MDDPADLEKKRLLDAELNRGAELVGSGITHTTKSTRFTRKKTRTLTVGGDCLMWSTSVEPADADQWELWRRDLEESYDHVTPVLSPRRLARELGLLVLHEFGPQGAKAELKNDISGVVSQHSGVMVVHGPVVYTDDPFRFATEGPLTDFDRVVRPMFVKHTSHQHQREYRFVVSVKSELDDAHVDLQASPGLLSALGDAFPYDAILPAVPAGVEGGR